MKVTIIGASGFIGSHLVSMMQKCGFDVETPLRGQLPQANNHYGAIVYCAGIKSNFIEKLSDLVEAHISYLISWLKTSHEKFVYLSTTRIYMGQKTGLETNDSFSVKTNDLYNQSKLLGESLCNAVDKNCLILRPSNVVGLETHSTVFLWQAFKQALNNQRILIEETACNIRDYVPLQYLLDCIVKLIHIKAHGIYNISSGTKISNGELCNIIAEKIPLSSLAFGEKIITFPSIPNEKVVEKTGLHCPNPCDAISDAYQQFLDKGLSP